MITEYIHEPLFYDKDCKKNQIRLYLKKSSFINRTNDHPYIIKQIEYEYQHPYKKNKLLENKSLLKQYPNLKQQMEDKKDIDYVNIFFILCTNFFIKHNLYKLQTYAIIFDVNVDYYSIEELTFIIESNGGVVKIFNTVTLRILSINEFNLNSMCCICTYNVYRRQVSITGIRKEKDGQLLYNLITKLFVNHSLQQ